MRIYIAWDNPDEVETIESFLNIGDNSTTGFKERKRLIKRHPRASRATCCSCR